MIERPVFPAFGHGGYAGDAATDDIAGRFKMTCRRCGSENVVLNVESGHVYSEHSADGDSVTIGCNGCCANYAQSY